MNDTLMDDAAFVALRLQESSQPDEAHRRFQRLLAEHARLRKALAMYETWLSDALSRNQIVHEIDRRRAKELLEASRAALAGSGDE